MNRTELYSASDFPEITSIAKSYPAIRKECVCLDKTIIDIARDRELWAKKSYDSTKNFLEVFKDTRGWIPSWEPKSTATDTSVLHFPLVSYGTRFTDNLKQCPTLAKLLHYPSIILAELLLLTGSSQTPPHRIVHSRLVYNLGILVPDSDRCTTTIDTITHKHKEGQPVVYDPSYDHFSSNTTSQDCIVLRIEFEK